MGFWHTRTPRDVLSRGHSYLVCGACRYTYRAYLYREKNYSGVYNDSGVAAPL